MASGDTFLAQVEEGLNTTIAAARQRRDFAYDIMPKLSDRQTLKKGTGTAYQEFIAENLTAQSYNETDIIDNSQQLDAALLTATPQLVAIQTFIGKRVAERLSSEAFAMFGTLAQNAIQRKKNTDGHALFASATTTLGTTGTPASFAHITAAADRIRADATEPGPEPLVAVLHGYTINDIRNEIVAGVGTYPVPTGMTEDVYKMGFEGKIGNVMVYLDGLIAVDSTPDSRGGVFSSGKGGASLLVQGISPWRETKDRPEKGYGGVDVWLKDEYVYAERSAGNWLFGHIADASAPTG